ncbi:hypothetical protein Salat_0684700 [Sesamum alatum]|uniref:Uncharacterized protein n=1 Tax=Sesamum alatum TaxID=300844 RepID=A0AAE2CV33_9LAMI|nr:hypothetical protein Salat_0684700 [Sesamum alatum]
MAAPAARGAIGVPEAQPVVAPQREPVRGAAPQGAFQAEAELSDDKSTTTQTSHSDAVMELMQLMKNTTQTDPRHINFAQLDEFDDLGDFAGTVALNACQSKLYDDEWILDSGATNHMSGNLELFNNFSIPEKVHDSVPLSIGAHTENLTTIDPILEQEPSPQAAPLPIVRRCTRAHAKPVRMQDFVCNSAMIQPLVLSPN